MQSCCLQTKQSQFAWSLWVRISSILYNTSNACSLKQCKTNLQMQDDSAVS